MQTTIEQSTTGLIIWQVLLFAALITLFYFGIKFLYKINFYLSLKIKVLKHKLEDNN